MAGTYLKSVSGEKQVELRDELLAGRGEDCDLVLTEGHPSRKHARLSVRAGSVWVEDLGSTNGTYVNGQMIDAAVELKTGDLVRFDAEEYEFVDPAATSKQPTPDPNATVLRSPPTAATQVRTPQPAKEAAAKSAPVEKAPVASPPAAKAAEQKPSEEKPSEEKAAAPAPEAVKEQPEAAPAAAAPEASAKPEAPAKKAGGGQEKTGAGRRPGAWADPDQAKGGATVMLTSDQIQDMLSQSKAAPEPLAEADTPYLVVTAGARAGNTVKLSPGAQVNVWDIGSESGRDIVFEEGGVSGFHAKIVNEGARWKIIDQMSANGTLVNDKKGVISFLSPGDRIRFGPVECVFQLPSGKKAGAARKAGSTGGAGASNTTIWWIAGAALCGLAVAGYLIFMS